MPLSLDKAGHSKTTDATTLSDRTGRTALPTSISDEHRARIAARVRGRSPSTTDDNVFLLASWRASSFFSSSVRVEVDLPVASAAAFFLAAISSLI